MSSRLDRVYAQLLRDHPYGWALYKKVTTQKLHPGSCGYFDSDGDWQTLIDLTNLHNVADRGWTIPSDEIQGSGDPESMIWGPKNSDSVRSCHVGGKVGTTVVGAPVAASVAMSFESTSDKGAVLATESPVLRHQIGDETSALQWMAENTAEMLRRHGSVVKKHGIWVVTKTYSTRRSAVAVMTQRSSKVEIGLGADVQGLLTLSPESSWTSSTGSSSMELHEDDNGVVVFISGMYFSKKLVRSRLSYVRDQQDQKGKILRGDNLGDTWDSEDENTELDVEYYPPLDEDNF
ncbi:hypothetical protein V8C34DRAFT_296338 [Trichoderma compactum]